MKRLLLVLPALFASAQTPAAPERAIALEPAKIETLRIEGAVKTWLVDKVCIDGQAYLMVLANGAPGAIAPAFKDGKPEQCQVKPARTP